MTMRRRLISQDIGCYHIISRVVGQQYLLKEKEKKQFLEMLKRFASGFFIRIHAFCIMSNHFHILATYMDKEAGLASKEELLARYKLIYPDSLGPPEGTYDESGRLILADGDGGIERLRERLGSLSSFVQELKQSFSRLYNSENINKRDGKKREGCFWSGRFLSIIVSPDEAQLLCSTYIDLNPVRAKIVKRPEDYPWSSLGLRVKAKEEAAKLLYPLSLVPISAGDNDIGRGIDQSPVSGSTISPVSGLTIKSLSGLMIRAVKEKQDDFSLYRQFVYLAGGVEVKGKGAIADDDVDTVVSYHDGLGILECLGSRVKNMSHGLAFGGYALIQSLQTQWGRKHIRPRSFAKEGEKCSWFFTTRVLRL